ncbi:hypothetical protein Lalb_Chr12g0197561 [Lupinus albus]|uniref:Uncharacterized protein n=1 Tax=Lupinus albus TaxID=3870 RepID=A0A6A4PL61_LUPAL|nr:hypothetical protein Lalb_Chr12g0197561 [Lupinus albus]
MFCEEAIHQREIIFFIFCFLFLPDAVSIIQLISWGIKQYLLVLYSHSSTMCL